MAKRQQSYGTSVSNLDTAIGLALKDYADQIFEATEAAVTAGAYKAKDILRDASPKGPVMYAKRWKVNGIGEYKLKRYVGNSTYVTNKKGRQYPLVNILEYSSKSPHQGEVKRTFQGGANEIARVMVETVKKGT